MRIWNAITSLAVALVLILAVLLVGVRLFGLQPYCILSGSMEPTYPTGALIYVRETPAQEIEVGDAITFVLNEDLVVATHRVIAIDSEKQQFTTQGDANASADGQPVHFQNLIGQPVFCIPYLGYVSNYVTQPPGLYVAIVFAVILLLLTFLPDWMSRAEKKEPQEQAQQRPAGPQ